MSGKHSGDDDQLVEDIYDALDQGQPERALASARIALHDVPDDPVLHFLAGIALLELEQPEQAVEDLTRAIAADPDDPEFRTARAQALFSIGRFAEAKDDALAATSADRALAEPLQVIGLVLEREGRYDEADRLFREAHAIEPERFAKPARLSRAAFEGVVLRAAEVLPEEFRRRLEEVPVVVEDLPSDEILFDETPPLDPELLGLFVGTALTERSFGTGGVEHPPRILLFQRNLERYARNEAELRREIARTLHHELAHYLGFAEEQMVELDLD
jgi:predicted Zn-dependent protease with MMP-like domain/Tfp pilus assembly protein PilF